MKIAVAAIALNEAKHIERWFNSSDDADYRFVLDTGSIDETLNYLHDFNAYAPERVGYAQQIFNPWRFDHARNTIWDYIPDDIDFVIWLDMDEILEPGWREALEAVPNGTTRPRYKYVWSWNTDGTEGLVYGGDKICARHGYTWKHPVHEVLKPVEILEQQSWVDGLEIHHHPDHTKSRGQYFPLLKLAVEEEPNDDRNQFYLAREYFFHGESTLAQHHFAEHYRLSGWPAEKAANRRYMAKLRPTEAEFFLYQAVSQTPDRREPWVDLALLYYRREDWQAVRAACHMALRVSTKPLDYLCEAEAWGATPHDLLALASHKLGDRATAVFHGDLACRLAPDDERLKANLRWYAGLM